MTMSKTNFKKIAIAAAVAGDSKKAEPVTIFDLAGKSPLADYAVLLVAESAPQLDAIEEEVQVRLKQEGIYCLHRDGMRSKNWKVLDYGGVLVHIYEGKAAEFYAIDKVYEGYKTVEWQEKPEQRPAAPAVKVIIAEEAPVKIAVAAKPAAKKPAAKKAAAKKIAVEKPPVKKPAAKKPAAKKPAVKKPAAKKIAAKKTAVKKSPAKKIIVKRAVAKKAARKVKLVKKISKVKKSKPAKKAVKKTVKRK